MKSKSLPQSCLQGLQGLTAAHFFCQALLLCPDVQATVNFSDLWMCHAFSALGPFPTLFLLPELFPSSSYNLFYLGGSTGLSVPAWSYQDPVSSLPQAPRGDWLIPAEIHFLFTPKLYVYLPRKILNLCGQCFLLLLHSMHCLAQCSAQDNYLTHF